MTTHGEVARAGGGGGGEGGGWWHGVWGIGGGIARVQWQPCVPTQTGNGRRERGKREARGEWQARDKVR